MSDGGFTGGCLCGALRYQVTGPPRFAGLCYCVDFRRASRSGFIPFLGVAGADFEITGAISQHRSSAFLGGEAVRNSCAACSSLVFGGEYPSDTSYTVYAGSLDDASIFEPSVAIFERDRPSWAPLPPSLCVHSTLPD